MEKECNREDIKATIDELRKDAEVTGEPIITAQQIDPVVAGLLMKSVNMKAAVATCVFKEGR
ncbi:MAG: hypothetical protein NC548_38355 [Lachnospiraceae bacterium]|nr:hypothetical protein [Lachnospiraceae bacterium]